MTCKWCEFNNQTLMLKEYKYWRLSIAESQILLGWSHASLKRHILYFDELTNEELIELKLIVKEWRNTIDKVFKPDWFNVMQLGNMTKHLHFQLVPRYKEKRVFAGREFFDKTFGKPIPDGWIIEEDKFLEKLRDYIQNNQIN